MMNVFFLILMLSSSLPSHLEESRSVMAPEWGVLVHNNEHNTYEEVMTILMIATGCDADEAYIETWDIDHYGSCIVHRGSEAVCLHAADVIRSIGIVVEAIPAD